MCYQYQKSDAYGLYQSPMEKVKLGSRQSNDKGKRVSISYGEGKTRIFNRFGVIIT